MSLFLTLRYIVSHPLNRGRKVAAVIRFAKWQLKSRITTGDIQHQWINGAKILASQGETGVTGNIYCGLHEFADMAFLLHVLQSDDTFIDIGANVGSYTVLASAAIGAKTICFEPVPQTYQRLCLNIELNDMGDRVTPHNIALSDQVGELPFSTEQNCMNHVLAANESINASVMVPVSTLDECLSETPLLIKIDVEGYELPVLKGAHSLLTNSRLKAVILELNGSGQRYGYADDEIVALMNQHGFKEYLYEPFSRSLSSLNGKNVDEGNTLFLRDVESLQQRIESAPDFEINGVIF